MIRTNKTSTALIIILLVIASIALAPAIAYKLPIVQTDGATHYTYAKLYVESGLDAKNPEYNKWGSGEEKVSDYPPFTTIVFGNILRFFGNDVFWINGGLGLIFIIIAAVSLYFFVKDVFNSSIALIALLFFALNLRIYYTLFVGIYPALIAACLSIPALYFSYKFFSSEKRQVLSFVMTFIITALVIFTYPVMGAYLIILELFLWLGIKAREKLQVNFPKIDIKVKRSSLRELKPLLIIIPIALLFLLALKSFTINESRVTWLSEFTGEMFKQCSGYPCVWKYFVIMDSPLIVLFAALGFLYLLYKNKWDIIFLLIGALAIVMLGSIVTTGIVYLIYRFYVLFSILLAIPAAVFIYKIISMRELRKIGILLLVIMLAMQAAILGYFYAHIQPSISQSEISAAQILYQHKDSNILYLVKEKDPGSFKSFKWVLLYAKSEHYVTPIQLDSSINLSMYDYVFVNDESKLTQQENSMLSGLNKIFDEGNVQVFQVK